MSTPANASGIDGAFESDPTPPTFPVPERPALPKPERLNRNALTVVAVVMGVLVLAAVVFVQPKGAASASQQMRPAPEMAHETFLDQPSSGTPSSFDRRSGNAPASGTQPSAMPGGVDPSGATGGTPYDAYTRSYAGRYAGPYGIDRPASAPVPVVVAPHADPRAQAYRAALDAPLVASEAASAAASAAASTAEGQGTVQPTSADMASVGASAEAIGDGSLTPMPMMVAPRRALPVDSRYGTSNAVVHATGSTTLIRTSVDPAPGPYAIQAGTLIPAILMTEINSDLPGEVLAQVSRDVYDSRSEQALLIPKGSRLLGKYDNQVAAGQNRLLVAWTRVIFPDGRSVSLPGLETKDRAGAGGLNDRVGQHTRRAFGTAALLSLIGAGAQLSQPNGGYGAFGAYPSTGQIAAGAVGQQLSEVATQMLRRNMNAQPTIRIRQGIPFNVFLNADMVFPGPYASSYTRDR